MGKQFFKLPMVHSKYLLLQFEKNDEIAQFYLHYLSYIHVY